MVIPQQQQTLYASILTQGDTATPSVIKVQSRQNNQALSVPFGLRVQVTDGGVADAANAEIAATSGYALLQEAFTASKDLSLQTPLDTAATGTLTISGVVIDGETATVGADVYEFDTDGSTTEGNISVDISGGATASQGTLTVPTLPTIGDTMTVGTRTYAFVADGTANNPGEIGIGVDSVAQVETFTAVADVASSLDGLYLQLSDEDGTVGVWIDVGDTGTTIPAGASALDRALECTTIAADDTANSVATAIAATINADSKFAASATDAVVTVTHATKGAVADGAAGTSTFTDFTVTTDGADLTCHPQIVAAINGTDGWNTANATVSIASFTSGTNAAVLTAKVPGTAGDAIVTTETFTAAGNIFDGTTLGTTTAGVDCVAATAVTALAAASVASGTVATGVDGAGDTVVFTSTVASVASNSIATTEEMANGAFGAETMTGGASANDGELRFTLTNGTAGTVTLVFGPPNVRGLVVDYSQMTLDVTHAEAA